jgi:hypothetical protein
MLTSSLTVRRLLAISTLSGLMLTCAPASPTYISKNYSPAIMRQVAVLQPVVRQRIKNLSGDVETDQSQEWLFGRMLCEQAPDYLPGNAQVSYPVLSQQALAALKQYLNDIPSNRPVKALSLPRQLRTELATPNIQFALIFSGWGLENQRANYEDFKFKQASRDDPMARAASNALLFGAFGMVPIGQSPARSKRSMMRALPHQSRLDLFVVNLATGEVVRHQRNDLFRPSVDSLTIRQHLIGIFEDPDVN